MGLAHPAPYISGPGPGLSGAGAVQGPIDDLPGARVNRPVLSRAILLVEALLEGLRSHRGGGYQENS